MPIGERELYCILMPIGDGKVLLPRSIVEEVRALGEPVPLPDAPPWLLGRVRWRHDMIPLVAIEPLAGVEVPPSSRRARMVVVRTPADTLQPPAMAILAQGFPYILRVTPELLAPSEDSPPHEALLAEIKLGFERPVIPDLPTLASEAAGLLAAA
jgi:chemosensory pili system protein ChpC